MAFVGRGQQSSVGFDPGSLGGLALWLDAADTATFTLSGSNVTTWRDKSELKNNATTTGGSPVLQTSNGLQGVYIASGTERMVTVSNSASLGNSARSVFMVANRASGSSVVRFGAGSHTVGSSPTSFGFDVGGSLYAPYTYSTDNNVISVDLVGTSLVYADYDTAATTIAGSYNGGTFQSRNTAVLATTTTPWYIGQRPDSNGSSTATFYEILHYTRKLGTLERQQVEGYLARKWGLATPSGTHPFRYAPAMVLPTQIAGCVMWLDAADATTFTLSGSNITEWRDKSGRGYTLTVPSGKTTPTYSNGVVNLAGSNALWSTSNFEISGNSQVTLFAVFSATNANGLGGGAHIGYAAYGGGTPTYFAVTSFFENPTNTYVYVPTCYVPDNYIVVSNSVRGTRIMGCGIYNGARIDGTYNGTLLGGATLTTANFSAQPFQVGIRSANNTATTDGTLCEAICYNVALTTAQRQQIEGYLAWKWGLQTTLPTAQPALPAAHPFRTRPPAVRPFSPLDVDGLSLWLDAADRTTLTLSGSNVTQWRDKSGNGNTASAGASPPVLSNYNGLSAIAWTASNQQLTTVSNSPTPGSAARSIFVVTHNPLSTSKFQMVTGTETGANPAIAWGYNKSANLDYTYPFLYSSAGIDIYTDVQIRNTPTILTTIFDGGTSLTGWINSSYQIAKTGSINTAATPWYIGLRTTGDGSLDSLLLEVIHYAGALTTFQRQQVETYLATKWGVRTSLGGTSSHPFRYGRPVGISPISTPIANLVFWLDAADTTTMTLSGSNVTEWRDKSGNGYVGTAQGSPVRTTVDGVPAVTFNGSTQYFDFGDVADLGTSPLNLFAVCKFNTSANGAILAKAAYADATFRYSLIRDSGNLYASVQGNTLGVGSAGSPNVPDSNTSLRLLANTWDRSTVTLLQNGSVLASTAFSNTTAFNSTYNLLVGAYNNTTGGTPPQSGLYLNGSINEILCIFGPMSTVQRQQVEGYLAAKWNLSSLPSDHPYRIVPQTPVPATIPGLTLWLDGADSASMTLSGSNVTQWSDKSGSNNHAVPNSTAPVLSTAAFGGRQSLSFNGSTMDMYGPISITGTTLTAIAVYQSSLLPNSERPGQRIVSFASFPNADWNSTLRATGINIQSGTSYSNQILLVRDNAVIANSVTVHQAGVPAIGCAQYTGSGGAAYLNGVVGTSIAASTGNFGVSRYGIANQATITNERLNGYIAEVIVYSTSLTDTQRQQLEGYLAAKWGLTSNLPSTHLYTTVVPGTAPPTPVSASAPGCALWLDAADPAGTGVTPSNGATVSTWVDKSGNGRNATGVSNPTFSNQSVVFNGSSYLTTSYTAVPSAETVFAVGTFSGTTDFVNYAILGPTSNNGRSFHLYRDAGSSAISIYSGRWGVLSYSPTSGVPFNTRFLVNGVFTGTGGTTGLNGGAQSASSDFSFSGTSTTQIGASVSAGAIFNGNLNEILIFSNALTPAQRQQVEGYLAWKWDLPTRLPSSSNAFAKLYRAVTPVFTPTQFSGCVVWFDAADATTLTLSGSNVTAWADKSGSGFVAVSNGSNTTARVQGSTINGVNVVSFPTLSQLNISNMTIANQNKSIFYVVRANGALNGASNVDRFVMPLNCLTNRGLTTYFSGTGPPYSFACLSVTGIEDYVNFLGSVTISNTPILLSAVTASGSNVATLYGTPQTLTTNNSPGGFLTSAATYTVGNASYTTPWDLGEMIIYNTALTPAQRRQVEGYLSWKWGLLPSLGGTTHPFRTGALTNLVPASTPVGGCTFWLDAVDATTFDLSGSNVRAWRDKINGVTMTTQGTLSNITRTQTGLNGRPSVYLNNAASDSVYMSGTLSNQLTGTAFYVIKAYSQRTVSWRPFLTWFNSAQFPAYGYLGDTTVNTAGPYTTSASPNGTPIQVLTPGGNYMISYGWSGTTTTVTTNGSAAQAGSQQAYSSSGTSLWLGADGTGASERITLEYGEVMLFNRVLSTIDRQEIEGYLASKWGLTASLPVGYPYSIGSTSLPATIPRLSLWLDGADLTSMTLSGSNVTQWRDKSGNGYNANAYQTGPVLSNQGLIFNGSGVLQGTTTYLHNPSTGEWTAFVVFTASSTSIGNPRILNYPPSVAQMVYIEGGRLMSYINSPANYQAYGPTVSSNVTYLVGVTTTTSNIIQYINGTSVSSNGHGQLPTNSNTTYFAGGASTGGDRFYGTINEILVFSNAVTTSQRQQVEGYLAWKWSLTSNLALDHPYKTSAPTVVAPTFVPASVAGLSLWLDASDTTTLTLSGSNVTAWADKSGLSNHMSISPYNSTNPTYSAATGVSFSNSAMHTNTGIQTMCAFTVYAQSDTGAILSGTTSGAGTSRIYLGVWQGTHNLYNVPTAGGTNTINSNTSFSSSALFVGSYMFDGSNVTAFANGTSTSNTAFSGTPGTSTNVILGGDVFSGSISRKTFSMRELLLYTAVPTAAQRQQIEGYLAAKWGLTSNFAVDHPYKVVAPGAVPSTPVPTSIPGCVMWLDAADTTTLTLSGSNVTQWQDKSGRGYTLTVPSGKTSPTYSNGVLTTTGSNALWSTANFEITGNSQLTMFLVYSTTTTAGVLGPGAYIGSANSATPPTFFGIATYQTTSNAISFVASVFEPDVYTTLTPNTGGARMMACGFYNGSQINGTYNGTLLTPQTLTTANFSAQPFQIGLRTANNSSSIDGTICECICYNVALTTAQRQQIEGYLAWKWGLQTNLPFASHPYKSFKP